MTVPSFAVGLPNLGDYADPALLAELARAAEDAGWDGVFLWDHITRGDPPVDATDPWVALAAVAIATERIRLGALVTPLARRRSWKLARETVAIDRLSGGRLVVGAGLGSSGEREFAAFGEEGDARVRAQKLDEGLAVLELLWSGETMSYQGEHLSVRDVRFTPVPVQRPRPPVWIAGRWPARPPFRRAARWDGAFPLFGDGMPEPEELAECVRWTLAERPPETRGRPFDVATEAESAPGERERAAAYAEAGLTWWIEKLGWWRGSVDDVRARIAAGPPR